MQRVYKKPLTLVDISPFKGSETRSMREILLEQVYVQLLILDSTPIKTSPTAFFRQGPHLLHEYTGKNYFFPSSCPFKCIKGSLNCTLNGLHDLLEVASNFNEKEQATI
jgi:hypothetical protein